MSKRSFTAVATFSQTAALDFFSYLNLFSVVTGTIWGTILLSTFFHDSVN